MLKAKKAPDFRESGNWLVIEVETGKLVATMYFDRQTSSWWDADVPSGSSYFTGYLGDTKEEALKKITKNYYGS